MVLDLDLESQERAAAVALDLETHGPTEATTGAVLDLVSQARAAAVAPDLETGLTVPTIGPATPQESQARAAAVAPDLVIGQVTPQESRARDLVDLVIGLATLLESRARDLVIMVKDGLRVVTIGLLLLNPQESLGRQVLRARATLQLQIPRPCHLTRNIQIAERLDGHY
jgi:hypothetical protein